MSPRIVLLLLTVGVVVLLGPGPRAPGAEQPLEFHLKDPRDDREISFADIKSKKAVVLVFLGTECPVSNAFVPVLAGLHREYADRGVAFIGVNANRQDTPDRVAAHAREHHVPFAVVKDPGNRLADRLGARRTPEAVVLDGTGRVLYRGRIDDQFGVGYSRPNKPTRRDLAVALDEILAGKAVSVPATQAAGCLISRVLEAKKEGKVTFARQVSRILQRHCQECHRPGQIGPMPLSTYDDAVSWADTIREVVAERRMPPWHADPRFGEFANDRRLPDADREALLAWLDGGLPRGDDKDLPASRVFPQGWRIGKPDVVVKMPEPYDVPTRMPRGGIPYRYFTVDPGFTEDRWVVGAEAHPGAPAVVHHIVVFIHPKGEIFNPDAPGSTLCGTAPGEMPLVLPDGFAKKVPAGAQLIFQMHYTPTGKAYRDQSEIGLIFRKDPPRHRVLTRPVYNPTFLTHFDKIPAGAENYPIEASHVFRQDSHLLAFMPHMHLRGKDFLYEAIFPDGKKQTLLSVPHYQFGWQSVYRCARPVAMPKGTRLHCVAHFDNSAGNPSNPDPKQDVWWGDQTWQEMMIGWIDFYRDSEKP
jgi:thiol-disulfide isomerase/thioredoxin/mono/diheme cytochrome c family protein